jgi:2-phosphoglycerate kinase
VIHHGYLIGGAPLTGKTFWAEAMVARHGAVRVCTDDVCAELKRATTREAHPELFFADGRDVVSFYATYDTPQRAVAAALLQAYALEAAIESELRHRLWRPRLPILEGCAMTPGLMRRLQSAFRHHLALQPLVFYDDDADRIRDRIRVRGLWRRAGEYDAGVMEQEVAYVVAYNDWFREEARKHGCLLLHVETLGTLRFR